MRTTDRRSFLAALGTGAAALALPGWVRGATAAATRPGAGLAGERAGGAKTMLGADAGHTRLLLNGKPTFLLGISYYGGLGASEAFLDKDFADIRRFGFNWIRVWVTWAAFGNDVSAFDAEGRPREPYLSRLKALARRCDEAGMVLDATFSRGNGVVMAPLATHAAHLDAARTLAEALKPFRNVYIDLGNERNIKDRRHVTYKEVAELRAAVKAVDPSRLVTASYAGDMSADDVREYVQTAGVDFLSPHRPRNAKSPAETAEKTREYLRMAEASGRRVPVHHQEPFRCGFSAKWDPTAADFLADLKGALAGDAAGWCFHNGDQRKATDGRPRRSFDLRPEEGRLFDQLEPLERTVVESVARTVAESGKA